jgi:cytochrome oxidase Cu insertion factor (SCO1/SenC/PrrC family)
MKGFYVILIMKRFLFFAIVIFILAAGTYSCQMDKTDKPGKNASSTGPALESNIADMVASMNLYAFNEIVKAPDFELLSVKDEKVSLGQHRGKVVLLTFWTTW